MIARTADLDPQIQIDGDFTLAEQGAPFQYLDRFRRVLVGPSVALAFENSTTLQFRVNEVRRCQRRLPRAVAERMLGWYDSLLPAPWRLSAAVTVRRPGRRPTPGFNGLADAVAGGEIVLRAGSHEVRGEIGSRAGDRILGPAFWVAFEFEPEARAAFADFSNPASIAVNAEDYSWESEPLAYEVRRSLWDDLRRPSLK